ncbi:MAG: HlyD family efflux transporter periplasmic adaptor subunit [FCB group bacterium]|nr:HlyD family efflux transporter periplasmic adaptor subunit [FCB group bacterium]
MKKYLLIGGIIVVVIVVFWIGSSMFGSSRSIPMAKILRGPLVVSLSENGRLDAERSMTISAPRIRGGLQIVKLADEGSMVEEGDFLIQFDSTEPETRLRDAESELKIANANLERSEGQYVMDMKQLELELKKAERSFSEKQSEAPVIRKEAQLELDLAQLKHDTQKIMLEAEIKKQKVEVDKATETKERATRDLNKMTITAPIPGLVVYMEIWKGGSMEKVQEGDSPWGGQGLINLPDLSTMVVEAAVSEVDVSKVELGQPVEIRLDAIPGPIFTGEVTDISTLARRKERGSQINVFDIDIRIDSADTRLKPGMSAKVDVVIKTFDDVLSIPIEAVFERDDTTVVYKKGGKKVPVALGERNDQSVIITSGLEENDEICLIDPTRKLDEPAAETGNGMMAKRGKKKSSTTSTTVIITE